MNLPTRVPRDRLAGALRRMLRPIVRRLLSRNITYPVFDEIARSLFVEVAEQDLALPGKPQTDSRISLVTGLHRREVVRLRGLPAEGTLHGLEQTVTTRLVGRWMAGPPYTDRSGRARTLPYDGGRESDPSFSRLVRETGFDGPARSVLDEMVRTGAARLRDDGQVELVRDAEAPAVGLEGQLELLGTDPGEIVDTIFHNMETPGEPWLHRKVVYDNVGSDALPELRARARDVGAELVREANALLAAQDRDRNPDAPGGRRSRVVVATYYFEEPLEGSPPESPRPGATSLPRRILRPGSARKTRSKR